MNSGVERRRGRLTIDLEAIKQNHALLARRAALAECGAVLKANAYGVGLEAVAHALENQTETFFVAHPEEGRLLREHLAEKRIFVLHGCSVDEAPLLARNGLIPVLNTLEQARGWAAFCGAAGENFPAALQFDTGMSRFGLAPSELAASFLPTLNLELVMSHLACADEPEHPANRQQRDRFVEMARRFPGVPRSLAATSGIFLGPDYLFELVRPGMGLYGLAPNAQENPLKRALTLDAPVLQLLDVGAGVSAGYGLEWSASRPTRLATVGIGYADGFFRSLGNRGALWCDDERLPVVGRVSMDSVIVDISALPVGRLQEGDWVSVLGPHQDVDTLAEAAGTIGYEVLTSLSPRFTRCYEAS